MHGLVLELPTLGELGNVDVLSWRGVAGREKKVGWLPLPWLLPTKEEAAGLGRWRWELD